MSAYKLSNLIRARFPVIYITTFEEDRVTKYIKSVVTDVKQVKFAREVFTWTQTNGLYNTTTSKTVNDTACPCKMLEFIRRYEKDAVFIIYDFYVNFGPKIGLLIITLLENARHNPGFEAGDCKKNYFSGCAGTFDSRGFAKGNYNF